MTDTTASARRPTPVTLVAWLVLLAGVLVLAAGIALAVERSNELVQMPALVARIDQTLPFDDDQDLSTYVTGVGIVVAVVGLLQAALAWLVLRGRGWAYVTVVVLLGALAAGSASVRAQSSDDLETAGVTTLGGAVALLVVLLLALLLGRRSRAWVLGRRASAD
jgi:hypothetical protein